ncbi:MAG: helix-turn-helix transcriptional regulator [Acetobacteraceae bacterium]|nr:helix-turn-helix transcriptional regulator [Acetobacteraceae bacterium]
MAQILEPFRIGRAVAEARRSAGLTLHDLSRRAGVSPSAIFEMEKGSGRMRTAARVLDALDVRIAGLPASGGPTLHGRLRAARERRGWSVADVAARAGVSENAVRRVEGGGGRVATVEALLRLLAPQARVRREERARWQSGRRDTRLTPPAVVEALRRAVGRPFDLDPCHHPGSLVGAATAHGIDEDGLRRPWRGAVFVNPPFTGAAFYIRRAFAAWRSGEAEVIVMLLAAQPHQATFHDYIFGAADVFLLRGRVRYLGPGGEVRDRAPFPVAVAIFGADDGVVVRMLGEFDCIRIPRTVERGTRSPRDDLRRSIG